MGDGLRRFFLSIGIALGLVEGRPDPELFARVFLEQNLIVVNARVEGAFVPEALELVQTGTPVALKFRAEFTSRNGGLVFIESTRSIRYDVRSSCYIVENFEDKKISKVIDQVAATSLVSSVQGMPLCPLSAFNPVGRIRVSVSVGIIDSSQLWREAPVLWNYVKLETELTAEKALNEEAG
jgi:hypothetical protein